VVRRDRKQAAPARVAATAAPGGTARLRPLPALAGRLLSALLSTVAPQVTWHAGSNRQRQVFALTFDDGPHPQLTPALLEALRRHGAHATFFVVGERVAGNEATMRAIVAAGHELGNHLMTGEASIRHSAKRFEEQLVAADAMLRQFGPVRYFRPASGWFTPAMLRRAAHHGYRCVLGTVAALDARVPDPGRTARRLGRWIAPGSIVVLHEGSAERIGVIALTDALLSGLATRGYRSVTLSELLEPAPTAALARHHGEFTPSVAAGRPEPGMVFSRALRALRRW
jgi:peptidoglycan-N-acetylglucosamine deacetylase